MDGDALERLLSKQLMIRSQSRSDPRDDYEYDYEEEYEEEEDDDWEDGVSMSLHCSGDFGIVELCCHLEIDHYHQISRAGVCPVCAVTVSSDLIGHLTKQHGKMIKIQVKLKLARGQDETTLSLLKKEFYDEHMKSIIGNSCSTSHPDMAPDPLLSSFMYSLPVDFDSSSALPTNSDK